MKTSIVICCFDFTRTLRHITMACISNIRRFTDEEDYELIIVDNEPMFPIRDDYKVLHLEKVKIVVNEKDRGYYASLNQGAKEATGDYFCFMQPDIFVHEGWLTGMRYYLENNMGDVVWPDQFPQTRAYIKESYVSSFEQGMGHGGREAGCLMITRVGFEKTGGWEERLFNEFGEAAFYQRIGKAGLRQVATNKSLVTHITAGTRYTMWDTKPDVHIADMKRDAEEWKRIRES